MPGPGCGLPPWTQTRASIRRTPSRKSTRAGSGGAGSGSTGCQRAAGTSRSRCSSALDSAMAPPSRSSPNAIPYPGSYGSTVNETAPPDAVTRRLACTTPSRDAFPAQRRGRSRAADHEADRDALGQRGHVGDDPDHAVGVGGEPFQGGTDGFQRVLVQGAEALVEEHRIQVAHACGESDDLPGQREGQRQRGLERLATRQRVHRTPGPGVLVVDDEQVVALVTV